MKSPGKPYRVGVAIGVLLALSPLWGLLITAFGMARAFAILGNDGLSDQQALAHSVGLTLNATAVGLFLCPFGVAILAVSLALRARARHQSPPPLPANPAL